MRSRRACYPRGGQRDQGLIGTASGRYAPGMTAPALDNGFAEAVAIVADGQSSAARLGAATGFVRRHAGPVSQAALTLLGLPPGRSGHEIVLGHRDVERGAIRLIQLDGRPGERLRDGAQAWDSGGIFDINLRALPSIAALHEAFAANGFSARSPITDWNFGALAVREVVEDDADGLCVALMERVHPPLTGYEEVSGPASWVFNSTQVVPDFDTARAFYTETLGWQPVQETESMAGHDGGANCMGLPLGVAQNLPMRIGMYQSRGAMTGSVEIIQFGTRTLDFSRCAPPMRGWASLRFPVSDLDAMLGRVSATLGPVDLGGQRAAAVVTPWGARLEFIEA